MINSTNDIAASSPRELNNDELDVVAGAGLRNLDLGAIWNAGQDGKSGGGGSAGLAFGAAAETLKELMM